jgi:hypothetical protein
MKNLMHFRLRDGILPLALLVSAAAAAQHPVAAPAAGHDMGQMGEMHGMQEKPKVPSTVLTVIFGDKTLTLKPRDLADYPHQNVTVTNGHTKSSETYSGVPISAILTKLGVPFEKSSEHTLLKTYLVAEGTDGYKVLVSVYETLAAIRQTDAIVADAVVTDGEFGPLQKDGAFKLVLPGDTRPQRWVQNLKSLTFKTVE